MTEPEPINSRRLIAINSAVKYVSLVVINLLTFFLTPFLIRTLGPTLLGLKTLAFQALQFVGLAHTAMGISYERYAKLNYARGDLQAMNSTLSAGFLVSAVAAFLFATGSALLAWHADVLFGLPPDLLPVARRVFLLIGFTTAFLILTGVWETPCFVTERFYLLELGNLVCSIGAAVAVVLFFEYGEPSILTWVLLSNGSLVLWRIFFIMPWARRVLPAFRLSLSLIRSSGQLRELMAFGGLNFLGGVGYLLYYASDSIIISNLRELGPDQIVFYNVAQRWDPQIRMLVMAFVGTTLPLMTSLVSLKQSGRLHSVFLRGTRYSLLIGLWPAALLIGLAGPFLHHWVGADYARVSAPVMQLLMVQFMLCLPERMAYNVNIAYGRMGGPVMIALVGGLLNIVLSIWLVKACGLGLVGVALGSAVALLVVSLYVTLHALRLMDLSAGLWLREGCGRAAACVLPLAVVLLILRLTWYPANLLEVLIQFGLASMVYGAGVWLWGITSGERGQLLERLARFLRRADGGNKHG